MNIKAEVSFEISTGLPALLYLVERRVGRSKFVRNLESQKTLKLGSFEFLVIRLYEGTMKMPFEVPSSLLLFILVSKKKML